MADVHSWHPDNVTQILGEKSLEDYAAFGELGFLSEQEAETRIVDTFQDCGLEVQIAAAYALDAETMNRHEALRREHGTGEAVEWRTEDIEALCDTVCEMDGGSLCKL